MDLASNVNNIRYNGTGRAYVADVGGTAFDDLGELENITYSQSVSTEKLKSTRNAARATILEVETEREATLTFGLREMTEANLRMALLAGAFQDDNQAAGYRSPAQITVTQDKYVELGHLNVYVRKLTHGTVSGGPFQIGETVTGGTSGATGVIAWRDSTAKYMELVNLGGGDDWVAGETITGGTSGATATLVSSEKLEDVIVTNDDDAPTTRYVQGTDYSLDPDYGLLRVLSSGGISGNPYVAYNHEAVSRKYSWAFSQGSVTKKIMFVTDKDDRGTRMRWTFHKVQINLNGDFPLIGEGATVLSVTGTVLADTSQPSGQEYFKVEAM